MPENNHSEEFELDLAKKQIRLRGSDILVSLFGALILMGLGVLGYAYWDHTRDASFSDSQMLTAINAMVNAQTEAAKQQRVTNCLIATKQEERESKLSMCERLAR